MGCVFQRLGSSLWEGSPHGRREPRTADSRASCWCPLPVGLAQGFRPGPPSSAGAGRRPCNSSRCSRPPPAPSSPQPGEAWLAWSADNASHSALTQLPGLRAVEGGSCQAGTACPCAAPPGWTSSSRRHGGVSLWARWCKGGFRSAQRPQVSLCPSLGLSEAGGQGLWGLPGVLQEGGLPRWALRHVAMWPLPGTGPLGLV